MKNTYRYEIGNTTYDIHAKNKNKAVSYLRKFFPTKEIKYIGMNLPIIRDNEFHLLCVGETIYYIP